MSIRSWEEIAAQKKQVENQRERILNAFKKRKVEDAWGTIKAEKLFKPITKLLGVKKEKEEEEKFPDYNLIGNDINFMGELPLHAEEAQPEDPYAKLKPFTATESDQEYEWDEIIPVPEKSSPDPKEITPIPDPEELGPEVLPGEKQLPQSAPSYSEATKDDKPPKYKEPRDEESNDLTTLNKFLQNSEGKPKSIMKTKKSKFKGINVEEARYRVREIYTERAKKVLAAGDSYLVIGQKGLGPYEGKSNKEMRAMIAEFEKGKGEAKIGSGFNSLVNRLALGISSILAGNTSVKLKNEIASLAKHLARQGIISTEQKNKVLSLK